MLLLLPLSTFLVDSGLTLLRRLVRGERWWTSHVQHAYQRWAAGVRNHTIVTLMYAGWTCAAWFLAWRLTLANERQMTIWCALWLGVSMTVWLWLQNRHSAEKPQATIGKDGK